MDGIPVYERVSIPSRRVGDTPTQKPIKHQAKFPSPQGGSETEFAKRWGCWLSEFPSPQGGSETRSNPTPVIRIKLVSIPSRRVGDKYLYGLQLLNEQVSIPSRRVGDQPLPSRLSGLGLVSIPSRRVGDQRRLMREYLRRKRFHPLKAGRRPSDPAHKGVK